MREITNALTLRTIRIHVGRVEVLSVPSFRAHAGRRRARCLNLRRAAQVLFALAQIALAQRALAVEPIASSSGAGPGIHAASVVDSGNHPVLDRIRSSGRIVLAHRESSIPFSYYDGDRHPVGYALDLCKMLAEAVRVHLGLKTLDIAYVPVTTGNRIDTIVSGKADLECGSTTNNAERRQKVAFTVPHYITGARIAVRSDSSIAELGQFENHVLVSTAGSTPFKLVDQANRERLLNIDVRAVPDNTTALTMLANRTADGFVMDDVQLYGLIAESSDPKRFKVVGKFLTIEPLAIMLSRDDAAFKHVIDHEMRELIYSGRAQAIFDRWFMQPIPPKQVAMNLPMSYLLKDSWRFPTDIVGN